MPHSRSTPTEHVLLCLLNPVRLLSLLVSPLHASAPPQLQPSLCSLPPSAVAYCRWLHPHVARPHSVLLLPPPPVLSSASSLTTHRSLQPSIHRYLSPPLSPRRRRQSIHQSLCATLLPHPLSRQPPSSLCQALQPPESRATGRWQRWSSSAGLTRHTCSTGL